MLTSTTEAFTEKFHIEKDKLTEQQATSHLFRKKENVQTLPPKKHT
jgi:hypothetical protein